MVNTTKFFEESVTAKDNPLKIAEHRPLDNANCSQLCQKGPSCPPKCPTPNDSNAHGSLIKSESGSIGVPLILEVELSPDTESNNNNSESMQGEEDLEYSEEFPGTEDSYDPPQEGSHDCRSLSRQWFQTGSNNGGLNKIPLDNII